MVRSSVSASHLFLEELGLQMRIDASSFMWVLDNWALLFMLAFQARMSLCIFPAPACDIRMETLSAIHPLSSAFWPQSLEGCVYGPSTSTSVFYWHIKGSKQAISLPSSWDLSDTIQTMRRLTKERYNRLIWSSFRVTCEFYKFNRKEDKDEKEQFKWFKI